MLSFGEWKFLNLVHYYLLSFSFMLRANGGNDNIFNKYYWDYWWLIKNWKLILIESIIKN
jgi:hypothetical protein